MAGAGAVFELGLRRWGTFGFGGVLVKDRFHAGGHGQYFDREIVKESWEPFIRRGQFEGTKFEVQMPTTPLWVSALATLQIKWVTVVLISLALARAAYYWAR